MFPQKDQARLDQAYRQSLLMGKASLEIEAQRTDGSLVKADVLLVSIHDHKTRFIGHYCLMEDRTYLQELEGLIQRLSAEQPAKA